MSRLFFLMFGLLVSLHLSAQPPRAGHSPRVLPNQFRDFVDHQQRAQWPKPTVEHKEGVVIITVSESQYALLQERRRSGGFRPAAMPSRPPCRRCERHHRPRHKSRV